MKKHILSFALVAALIGSVATGCSSTKSESSADSATMKDSNKMKSPTDNASNGGVDTTKKMMDTTKKDTTKKPPM
jgi:hypothetical protein